VLQIKLIRSKSALAATSSVTREEFFELLKIPPHSNVVVAVSGGADSMALLLLARECAQVTALTIDHGLRAESRDEAQQVKHWCEALNITHHTLSWQSQPLASAAQEQARNARYALLSQWCEDNDARYLLTAHHRDDQAETLFFRLARGSGIDGLAAIQPSVTLANGITLLRPLLSIPKARLIATLQAHGQDWIEDPSNQNPNYTRNRIRALIAQTGDADGICERAYKVSAFFQKFRNILENNTASILTTCTSTDDKGHITLDAVAFAALESDYGVRALASIVKQIGKDHNKPRTEKLERFYAQLCSDIKTGATTRRTFSHCLFDMSGSTKTIRIYPEHIV
jgi:tRNA(Ile)-lysidine synthase